jgi:hypothetical protein
MTDLAVPFRDFLGIFERAQIPYVLMDRESFSENASSMWLAFTETPCLPDRPVFLPASDRLRRILHSDKTRIAPRDRVCRCVLTAFAVWGFHR